MGQVDGEFVWDGGVGDEDAVGADRFEEGKFVEADCFVVYGVSVEQGDESRAGTGLPAKGELGSGT